ncbi:MAG: OmpH family outer membrane protein [Candidatus Omnitrophica bacterium]|nr:OmpH family outer membrane protein [Candidatus Omnitrophota bacterium]
MKQKVVLLLLASLGVVFLGNVCFAQQLKVAYVDLTKIFSEYYKTQEYDKILGDKQNAYEQERDKMVSEIKQFQDKMNLLSDKEKDAKKAELENKIKNLQEFDRSKQGDLRKEQDEKMKELLKDINEAIKQYCQQQGYTLVFNDRVLVYQDKSLDITDKIIEIINKNKPTQVSTPKKK